MSTTPSPHPAPDLRQRPPRSPRVRLGGFVVLPRLLDKARATLAGTEGEYCYNCPLDQRFFEFVAVEAQALQAELARGATDSQILAWIHAQARTQPTPAQILSWSAAQEQRGPSDPESRQFFDETHRKLAPHRADIVTWFELLDLDDYVSFGGQP